MTTEEAIQILEERFDSGELGYENTLWRWTPGDEHCPVCGESKFKGLDADIWADWMPAYCPNCGTQMSPEEK